MQISRDLARAELWIPLVQRGGRVLVILVGAWILTRLERGTIAKLRLYASRVMDRRGGGTTGEMEKRAATLIAVMTKFAVLMTWVIALVMSITELGFHIEPLLAGLGIAGLALGLGAQSLIKDWLGGLFLLLEDQIRIGDSVTINGFSGSVEEINLRTTMLRGENGAVHVIPNGSITALSNFTREYSYYVFETILAHHADADRALQILKATGAEIAADETYTAVILAPIEVMGIDRLTDRGSVIKARIKTLPSKQYDVGRELNRRMKQRLDEAGIPFPPVS